MLHTGEKREPQEGHQHKGDTSEATGPANCFHKGTVDVLSGGKTQGPDTEGFFSSGLPSSCSYS